MRNLKTEQIAAANYPYFKYSLEYALDSLERMGAARMEFYACYPHLHVDDAGLSQVRAVKRQLKDHHLTPICFTPEQCLYPVNIASRDVNARKRSLDVYVKSMEFAAEMDIELCQFLSGFGCLDEKDEDIWKRAVESVAYLGRIAQGYGITIALETSPKEYTAKGNDRYGHVGICR
ncbi:MAG: TIM barrel protein [Enterocloster bolteae]|nr:TIM barrel protein [Enterocloster bolteae]MDU1139926.1 TIM barrel protein [Enterocloster bolteae]